MNMNKEAIRLLFGVVFGLGLGLSCSAGALAAEAIERVEPPTWWVGMKSEQVQLMVHGQDIARFQPRLRYPGVSLESVQRVSNGNYLFLNLRIRPHARPGRLDLVFARGAEQLHLPYELQQRAPGSAQRQGFTSSDAILNLMPDRYANGDPSNDNVAGFPDPLNRADDATGRHGGDIAGIVQHLDYIAAMGYTMLWPTPLTESRQIKYSYHGYAATDTYRIDPRYGSNQDYRRMVALAREKGIGVIQDIVLNHIGSQHWWMQDMPSADWLTLQGQFAPTYHARTTANDPYAAQVDKKNYTAGWFEKDMPDMNQANPLVANYQIQNTIWWIEYAGLAGIRADTYGYSDHAFLSAWSGRVMNEYPRLNIVGEEWSTNALTVSYWLRGKKNANGYVSNLPSVMDYPLTETLRHALAAPDNLHSGLADLYEALTNDTLYPDPMNLVLFEGNHDIPRIFSMVDQDVDLDKMALAYLLTMRGIPQLYYGTEILMTSPKVRDDGAFRQDFPGGWAGDKINAFTGAGLTPRQLDMQAFLKRMLNWRKQQSAIHKGKLRHFAPENGTYAFFRYDDKQKIMVVFNKNQTEHVLDTARFAEILPPNASGTDAISGRRYDLSKTLALPPRSVLVLDVK